MKCNQNFIGMTEVMVVELIIWGLPDHNILGLHSISPNLESEFGRQGAESREKLWTGARK